MIWVDSTAGRIRSDICIRSGARMASRAAVTSAFRGERRMKNPNSRSTIWLVASTRLALSAASTSRNTSLPGTSSPISTVSPASGMEPCTVAPT